MNLLQSVKHGLNDKLTTFKFFERAISVICIAIPALLWLADAGNKGFRPSISDYVYMRRSYIFGMLLCMAAMMFIFNGAVYFKNEARLTLTKSGKWYNIVLGFSLLVVIILPYKTHVIPHDFFAGVFFVGNALVMLFFHDKRNRKVSITLALLTVGFFILNILLHMVTIFWAEWLSLTLIAIHFIMEAESAVHKPANG